MSTPKENKWAKPLGFVIIIFAIIGVVFLVMNIVSAITAKVDKSDEKLLTYQQMLVPVVMNDIDAFDDVTKANMSQLVEASIWAIIKSDIDTDTYENDGENLLFPAADVEAQFIKLFGTDVAIEHQTIETSAFEIEYDAEKQVYKVPITGADAVYTPKVLDMTKKSNTVILTVALLSAGNWTQDDYGNMVEPEPSKYVKITLREKDKSYYISAIAPTNAPETLSK